MNWLYLAIALWCTPGLFFFYLFALPYWLDSSHGWTVMDCVKSLVIIPYGMILLLGAIWRRLSGIKDD